MAENFLDTRTQRAPNKMNPNSLIPTYYDKNGKS